MKHIAHILSYLPSSFFGLLLIGVFATSYQEVNAAGSLKKTQAYCIGADISFVPQNESRRGKAYTDLDGKAKDICQIMADHHFNTIRLRLFVNPELEGRVLQRRFLWFGRNRQNGKTYQTSRDEIHTRFSLQ